MSFIYRLLSTSHSSTVRYAIGVITVAVVFLFNLSLSVLFKNYVPMSLYLSAIIAAAGIGGRKAGLMATFLGACAEVFYISHFHLSFFVDRTEDMRLIVYLIQGVLISLVFGELHKAQIKLQENDQKLLQALRAEKAARVDTEQALAELHSSQVEIKHQQMIAETANRTKSLFLANMSHEIRTPLTAILGFTRLLREGGLSEDEQKVYLGIIERTGNNLKDIINDILDISKVEAGKLELEKIPFSLENLLQDVRMVFEMKCAQKHLKLKFEKSSDIASMYLGDSLRLRQILTNLISNAVKFTDQGQITVSYGVRHSNLYFEVKDTGVGIKDENRENLFKNFSQADSSISRKYEGTGLGLSLSKKLAFMMGGTVELVSSTPGVGSVFAVRVDLPSIDEDVLPESEPASSKDANFKGKKVLLVDDSLDNQLLLRTVLKRMGFEVITASNGAEALVENEKEKFDLILMDMQMPVMDGYTATRELQEQNCKIPIVAITANAMSEDREKCMRSGCKAYISKPIEQATLKRVLSTTIRNFPMQIA